MNIAKQNKNIKIITKIAVITITPNGVEIAKKIMREFSAKGYTSDKLLTEGFTSFEGSMKECIQRIFPHYELIIFICATGIVVRTIAGLIKDKFYDPAILVIDERAQYVISLLSGHVGGANAWTIIISQLLNAMPVITTATDVNKIASLDLLIQEVNGDLEKHRHDIKWVNQTLISGEKIGLYLDQVRIAETKGFTVIEDLEALPKELNALVIFSAQKNINVSCEFPVIKITPKNLVLGIGCRKNTPFKLIYEELLAYLDHYNFSIEALSEMGSVSIKKDEKGLIELSHCLGIPFHIFDVATLKKYEDYFPKSKFVQKILGVGSVSQPAAFILSSGNLIGNSLKQSGITLTLGMKE